jgi:hypothetical protein
MELIEASPWAYVHIPGGITEKRKTYEHSDCQQGKSHMNPCQQP